MKRRETRITYGQRFETEDYSLEIYNGGHIPGSFCCLLEMGGKRIFYTSDFNTKNSRLLNGAKIKVKDVDLLIMESTYSNREHPARKETENKFFDAVNLYKIEYDFFEKGEDHKCEDCYFICPAGSWEELDDLIKYLQKFDHVDGHIFINNITTIGKGMEIIWFNDKCDIGPYK